MNTTKTTKATNNRKEIQKRYDDSANGRVRCTKAYHISDIAPITIFDNFTGKALEKKFAEQKGRCVCCGRKFDGIGDLQMDHISHAWFFSYNNIQLICADDNNMKKGLVLPFAEIKAQTGKNFLQLVRKNPAYVQETFCIDDNRMTRIIAWAKGK